MSGTNLDGDTTTSILKRPSAAGHEIDAPKSVLPFPRELRDKIYAYLFRGPWLVFGPAKANDDHAAPAANLKSTELAMLRVSKATRAEALPILYKNGIFLFRLPFTWMGWGPLFDAPMSDAVTQMNNITFEVSAEAPEGEPIPTNSNITNCERSIDLLTGAGTLRNSMHLTFANYAMCTIVLAARGGGPKFFNAMKNLTGFRELLIDSATDNGRVYYDKDAKDLRNYLEPWLGRAANNPDLTPYPHLVFHPSQYAAETMKADAQKLLKKAANLTGQDG